MKSQEVNMNITIKKMEYETTEILVDLFTKEIKNTAILVEFAINNIEGSLSIPLRYVPKMDEDKVIEYIYNYLNNSLERKFIDEF